MAVLLYYSSHSGCISASYPHYIEDLPRIELLLSRELIAVWFCHLLRCLFSTVTSGYCSREPAPSAAKDCQQDRGRVMKVQLTADAQWYEVEMHRALCHRETLAFHETS